VNQPPVWRKELGYVPSVPRFRPQVSTKLFREQELILRASRTLREYFDLRGSAMKNRLYWVAVGGFSFWLPAIAVDAIFRQNVNLWTLNLVPLAGVALLGVATWLATKHPPRWGWVLVGIYVLGPVSMLAPSVIFHVPSSPTIPGETTWMVLFCLFPPMTLWMALLNGMLFSVIGVTVILPFLAVYRRNRRIAA